jgi:aspartate aminotransferase
MTVQIADHLPTDGAAAMRATCTPTIAAMEGSLILGIAGQVRKLAEAGQTITDLTVGDFRPAHFPLPDGLRARLHDAVDAGETNYPPADGLPALRKAIADLYSERLGLRYSPESVCVCSGARPPIFATWALFVRPGDKTVSFLPGWNSGYYAQLFGSDHHFIPTSAADNFFPTVEAARAAIKGARLVVLNSPLNPTGTVISAEVLAGIAEAVVEENRSGRGPCILMYDQVYWALTQPGVVHHNPVSLVPACAPYVVQVDAISKWMAATGLRVGWAVLPPYLQERMKAYIGHVGAWAPRPEQVATAAFLQAPGELEAFRAQLVESVGQRLHRLFDGVMALRAEGLPVDAIAPQGGIYLSFRVDLIGARFATNEAIRRWLLEEAGVAVVPFQAFDMHEQTGWFRMSVGAVSMADIEGALQRLGALLRRG